MISKDLIRSTTIELLRLAAVYLPQDVKDALKRAYVAEMNYVPRMQLKAILDNIKLAEKTNTPICQDTGIPVFNVTLGDVQTADVKQAITEAVVEATKSVPLRPNAVHPLTRNNPGTNVGTRLPYINCGFSKDSFIEITAMMKGAGSENMSALVMLMPSQGIEGIKEFVLNTVLKAGSNPCPPNILGIGIGGTADMAMNLAREAILRPLSERNQDPEIAKLEAVLYYAINGLGIGPMGLGGRTTLLGVNIEYAHCHTASLPVALSFHCWAARRATARIHKDGRVEYLSHRRTGRK